jgi:2'-5' RNA ligase
MQKLSGRFDKMNFEFSQISAFPNLNNPRVIFLECKQTNGNTIYELQKELGRGLVQIGIGIDKRPWRAHITLGRVKDKLSQTLYSIVKSTKIKNKNFAVNSFELMESELKPDGAKYTIVASYQL